MIMKPDFVRGGLLGFLTGVAILAAWGRAEDMAMKIENFNFASGSVTMKGGTVIPTSADELRHAVTSTGGALKPKALDTEYDRGVICETQEQAERLAMLLDDNEDTAIATLNAEERDPSACAVETVAFVRGASLATARSKVDTFAVVEILVVGVDRGSGLQSIAPGAYFMLIKIDERNA